MIRFKKKITSFWFIVFLLFTISCKSLWHSNKSECKECVFDVDKYADYFDLTDTITLKVIHYIPAAFECGDRSYVNNCIGTTSDLSKKNDTIRVLVFCDKPLNSEYWKEGAIVKVAPEMKPKKTPEVGMYWFVSQHGVSLPKFHDLYLKTTYGRFIE